MPGTIITPATCTCVCWFVEWRRCCLAEHALRSVCQSHGGGPRRAVPDRWCPPGARACRWWYGLLWLYRPHAHQARHRHTRVVCETAAGTGTGARTRARARARTRARARAPTPGHSATGARAHRHGQGRHPGTPRAGTRHTAHTRGNHVTRPPQVRAGCHDHHQHGGLVAVVVWRWCGVVWCRVVSCGVVWCRALLRWCGVVWCGVVLCAGHIFWHPSRTRAAMLCRGVVCAYMCTRKRRWKRRSLW